MRNTNSSSFFGGQGNKFPAPFLLLLLVVVVVLHLLLLLVVLRPCNPRTDASDHIFVLGIFILLLLLVVVVVLLGELLGDIKLNLSHG